MPGLYRSDSAFSQGSTRSSDSSPPLQRSPVKKRLKTDLSRLLGHAVRRDEYEDEFESYLHSDESKLLTTMSRTITYSI